MLELSAKIRPKEFIGKRLNILRKTGEIPAVLYGHNIEALPLQVKLDEFEKIFNETGESTLIKIKINNGKNKEERTVLIHEIVQNPITDKIIHADFYQVKMDEKIKTHIPLEFIGEAPAIKELGGVLVKNIQEIEIEAFPRDLIPKIEIDISSLNAFEDRIKISDLKIGEKIKILTEPEIVIALIVPPKEEIEEVPAEVKPTEETMEEIKTEKEAKREEELKQEKVGE